MTTGSKTTARFELERRTQLEKLFTVDKLTRLWRQWVKGQMRDLEIKDLHDYYDFNYSIEKKAEVIIERILGGQYRAEAPLVYRKEKKFGVCRHMMIPSPSDALVFQLLTDELYPSIIDGQPSAQAYYSRGRHSLSLPHEHRTAGAYPWFILWPQFQKEIWEFSQAHPYLVTTDLTNYFDNIGLRELRHVISAIAKTKEVYLDLLFSLIEDLSWKPDYLPTSHKGLPTINIEALRLLAHALLFEVDYLLDKRTKGNFVRWMDDINFGAPDLRAANNILGQINDVLKSRGLALNLAKTEIMTSREAKFHFMFNENIRLSDLKVKASKLKKESEKAKFAKKLEANLLRHLRVCKARNKDKVTKRYFTILGSLGCPFALKEAKYVYINQPALRESVLFYLTRLPFSEKVASILVKLLDKTDLYDDATRFGFVSAIVNWSIPKNKSGTKFVNEIHERLKSPKSTFDWYCQAYFLAKYGRPHEVVNVAISGKKYGVKEPFFARQRVAIETRGLGIRRDKILEEWRWEISTGFSDSASVANNLFHFATTEYPRKRERAYAYLFPEKKQAIYPLSKFLLLCALASSEESAGKTVRRSEVSGHVTDPWYLFWLKEIHPTWF